MARAANAYTVVAVATSTLTECAFSWKFAGIESSETVPSKEGAQCLRQPVLTAVCLSSGPA
jgi:hypothetical protein